MALGLLKNVAPFPAPPFSVTGLSPVLIMSLVSIDPSESGLAPVQLAKLKARQAERHVVTSFARRP